MKAVCSGVLGSVLLLLSAGAGHAAAVFGVELGDDIDRYRFESPAVSVRHELKMYEVAPPHPDSRFDTYAVDTLSFSSSPRPESIYFTAETSQHFKTD